MYREYTTPAPGGTDLAVGQLAAPRPVRPSRAHGTPRGRRRRWTASGVADSVRTWPAPPTTSPPGSRASARLRPTRRRAAGQGNDVEVRAGRTYGRIVRDNVFNFINNLFYFLGILLLVLGKPLDAFAVVFVIGANTVISLFQEIRAKRVMDKMAILLRPKADVVRDGDVVEIDPSLVVLGDVLRLEPGDQVVVDGPMVGEGRMEVDESLLTGESDLVTKHPGDELMSGSFCMTGGGYYEAAQVGLDSFANKLTAKAKAFKRELTPLQRQVVQIVRVLLIVVIVFEILVWVRNVIGGVPFVESVRMSTVILALIPNGLVLSIALTYALGAMRLLGKDVLVQQFNAVESLSNVDVLCTDKTGTLTSGVVTFEELAGLGADDARAARLLGAFAASTTDANRTIEALRTAFRRSACRPRTRRSSRPSASGAASPSPTGRRAAPTCSARPRCSRRRSAPARTGARRPTSGPRAACASSCSPGATSRSPSRRARAPPVLPDEPPGAGAHLLQRRAPPRRARHARGVLRRRHRRQDHLRRQPQDGGRPRHAGRRADAAAPRGRGLVLRHGERAGDAATAGDRRRRPRRAGRGGRRRPAPPERALVAVSGAELAELSPEDFAAKADEAGIFGRVTPEQKQDLVEALRDRGRYVAMIGDGVNDVIALKQANVAVAMQGGSQAARSVGDLILMKDTFAPLPFAFREGQRIINGMNDILRIFMVRIFFKAAMIAIVMAIGGFPFAPRQSALLSFFGATVPAIAFALWAQPGPTPKVGLFKLLARFVLPTVALHGGDRDGHVPDLGHPREERSRRHPGATEKELIESGYPPAMTALTIFACFAAIFLILLIVPPTKWWAGGAPVVRNDWRMVAVVGFLFACMLVVLAVPLGRTLFEITALPWWQYFVLLGLAFAWSQLCLLVWKTHLLDRWLGRRRTRATCARRRRRRRREATSRRA